MLTNEGVEEDKDKYYANAASYIFNVLGPAFTETYKRRVDLLTLRMLEATRELVRYYIGSVTATLHTPVLILITH